MRYAMHHIRIQIVSEVLSRTFSDQSDLVVQYNFNYPFLHQLLTLYSLTFPLLLSL